MNMNYAKVSPTCPVCHSLIHTLLYKKNSQLNYNSFTPTSSDFGIYFDLYKCEGCHTVFSLDNVSESDIAKLYTASKHGDYMLERDNRQRNFRNLIKTFARYLQDRDNVSILDIGSSTGLFLNTVKETFPNWKLSGIEPSKDAVQHCKELFNIELLQGVFEDISLPKNEYDIVTMLDLIEHVHNPLDIIASAHKCLKDNGLLVITTPNIESWTARLFKQRWWSFRLMHTLYYSPLSMQLMLSKKGFRVIKMRGLIRTFSLRYCLRHLGWTITGPSFTIPFPLTLGDMVIIARKETPTPHDA